MTTLKKAITILILAYALFVACAEDKNPSNSEHPQGLYYVGRCNTPDQAMGVIVQGNYAYVADHDSGMQIIEIVNPAQPTLAGHYQCPGASQIDLEGTYAYIADETLYSLEIVDISNPESPGLTGRLDTLEVLGIRVSGNYAYMGCGCEGLQIVDISNPATPSIIGSCRDVEFLRFELFGNHAIIPGDNDYTGLHIVNLSDASNPTVIGGVPIGTGESPFEVAIHGSYVYMTNIGDLFSVTDTGYLHIIDISNLSAPEIIDSMFLGNKTVANYIHNDLLYVSFINADTTAGLHVIDISNPEKPVIAFTEPINALIWDIWVENSFIYLAADTAGLLIYEYYP
jgi:hypothetical protein